MSFQTINSAALGNAIGVMGQAFTYLGTTYNGIVNELGNKQALQVGGFEFQLSCMVTVQKTAFVVPDIGAKITVNGKERRVVSYDEDIISYTLHLEDVNQ